MPPDERKLRASRTLSLVTTFHQNIWLICVVECIVYGPVRIDTISKYDHRVVGRYNVQPKSLDLYVELFEWVFWAKSNLNPAHLYLRR